MPVFAAPIPAGQLIILDKLQSDTALGLVSLLNQQFAANDTLFFAGVAIGGGGDGQQFVAIAYADDTDNGNPVLGAVAAVGVDSTSPDGVGLTSVNDRLDALLAALNGPVALLQAESVIGGAGGSMADIAFMEFTPPG